MPRKQPPKERALYVRLPADLYEAVKRKAADEDRTLTQVARRALKQYVEEGKGK